MTTTSRFTTFVLAVMICALCAAFVAADPLPTEFLKFQQLPLDGAIVRDRPWYGHDELSTARGVHAMPGPDGTLMPGQYQGVFMADDFADKFNTPVVHVRWWGSYIDRVGEPTAAGGGVQRFLISWETDIPRGPNIPFSRPGVPLQNEVLTKVPAGGALLPGSGTFTEKFRSPGGPPLDEHLYEYNAELACPFKEEPDTVYWLKIVALNDPSKDGTDIQWGWHNRDWTLMDPFASTAPAVVPGEHDQGPLIEAFDPATGPVFRPVWHFQDDSVQGQILGIVDAGGCTGVNFEPQVTLGPRNYIDGVDGPGPLVIPPIGISVPGIGQFSKDLAFELYSIPEPSTAAVTALGLVALAGYGWRRRRV